MNVAHRPAAQGDVPFVFSSWLKSYRQGGTGEAVNAELYYDRHHALIERILRRFQVTVACPADDADTICGWECGDGETVLHYAYVKQPYRGNGICKGLLAKYRAPLTVTHLTSHVPPGARFNPYILMELA